MVRVVVPREPLAADGAGVCERAEPVRKLRPVLQGPELRVGERIVVAHAGPRMTGVDAQVREEQRDESAAHGRAAIRMDRELLRGNALLQAGGRNQAIRQVRSLVARDHPAHGVAAEEVEDDVQRVVEVRDRALELGDVPRPDLIRARRHELGFRIRRMPGLGASVAHFAGRREHAIHRARGTEVRLLLEHRGMDCGGRLVDEALAVQHVEHRLALGGVQRARRRRTGPRGGGGRHGAPTAIERRPGHADAVTQRRGLARRGDGLDGPHQSVSSSSRGVRGIPRISAIFFWRVMIVSARCNVRWSRRFSVSSCFTRGSTGRGVGPRRRPRISRKAPASRCRRQFVSSDAYSPSRRNRAPTSPGFLQASACLRMRSRYAAGKRRRWTVAATSGSGSGARDVVAGLARVAAPRYQGAALTEPYKCCSHTALRGSGFPPGGFPPLPAGSRPRPIPDPA